MRTSSCLVAFCATIVLTPAASPGEDAVATLTMNATVRSRTSLRVSSSELRFDVLGAASAPTVLVDFFAAARAQRDADVVLTVEAVGSVQFPPGGAPPNPLVSFQGEGGQSGPVAEGMPRILGAWKGSGVHQGRVSFTLQGATVAGTYVLHLRFVLSAG